MVTVGRNSKVNGVKLSETDWFFIDRGLNEIGPSQDVRDWKIVIPSFNVKTCNILKQGYSYFQHLDTMKSSVRSKVRMIFDNDGVLENDLTKLELKIYNMFPPLFNYKRISLTELQQQPDGEHKKRCFATTGK